MKTALSIIGIVFLVLLILGGSFIGFVIYEGNKFDASSKAYADASIQAIVTNWSKDELIKRESPQFRSATPDDQLIQLFSQLSQLGPLKSYEGSKGEAKMNVTPASGLEITAVYKAGGTFQNGEAEIKLTLTYANGEWKILGFGVNSPLFSQ